MRQSERYERPIGYGFYIPRWAIGVILALLLNAGAVVWGASSANTRLAEVERRMGIVESQMMQLIGKGRGN